MGHRYSDKEIVILDKNLDKINKMWNEYVENRLNGNDDDIHNPPAVNRAVLDLLNHILMTMANDGEATVGIELFAGFAANMFVFGQYAAEQGLKISDMLGCNCTEITDEDIQNLLRK